MLIFNHKITECIVSVQVQPSASPTSSSPLQDSLHSQSSSQSGGQAQDDFVMVDFVSLEKNMYAQICLVEKHLLTQDFKPFLYSKHSYGLFLLDGDITPGIVYKSQYFKIYFKKYIDPGIYTFTVCEHLLRWS